MNTKETQFVLILLAGLLFAAFVYEPVVHNASMAGLSVGGGGASLRPVQISDTDDKIVIQKNVARVNRLPTLSATNEEERLEAGEMYAVSRFIRDVSNNDTQTFLLTMPDTSTVDAKAVTIKSNSTAKMRFDMFVDVTVDSAGVPIQRFNANLGDTEPPVLEAESNGGYSGRTSTPFWVSFVPGGGSSGLQFGGATESSTILIPPGNNVLIEVTNISGGGEDLAINAKWVEGKF